MVKKSKETDDNVLDQWVRYTESRLNQIIIAGNLDAQRYFLYGMRKIKEFDSGKKSYNQLQELYVSATSNRAYVALKKEMKHNRLMQIIVILAIMNFVAPSSLIWLKKGRMLAGVVGG